MPSVVASRPAAPVLAPAPPPLPAASPPRHAQKANDSLPARSRKTPRPKKSFGSLVPSWLRRSPTKVHTKAPVVVPEQQEQPVILSNRPAGPPIPQPAGDEAIVPPAEIKQETMPSRPLEARVATAAPIVQKAKPIERSAPSEALPARPQAGVPPVEASVALPIIERRMVSSSKSESGHHDAGFQLDEQLQARTPIKVDVRDDSEIRLAVNPAGETKEPSARKTRAARRSVVKAAPDKQVARSDRSKARSGVVAERGRSADVTGVRIRPARVAKQPVRRAKPIRLDEPVNVGQFVAGKPKAAAAPTALRLRVTASEVDPDEPLNTARLRAGTVTE